MLDANLMMQDGTKSKGSAATPAATERQAASSSAGGHDSYREIMKQLEDETGKSDPMKVIKQQQLHLQNYTVELRQKSGQIETLTQQLVQARRKCLQEEQAV